MASPVELLQLSPTMTDGTIVRWLVKEGDSISAGDALAEVETDKAVMEQEAFEDGTVLKLMAPEGESVPVGTMIAVIGEEGEDISSLVSGGGAAKQEEEKKEAAAGGASDSKSAAPAATAAPAAPSAPEPASAGPAASNGDGGRIFASPLARKMAADQGLDLAALSGSGPNGRIVKRDIEQALASGTAAAATAPAAAAPAAAPVPAPTVVPRVEEGLDETITPTGMRKTIARRLTESRQTIPSFTVTVDVAAEGLLDTVKRLRERDLGEKVTVTHLIIKAMASTLMKHEWLRTQWAGDTMVRKNAAHISVAVAIDDGLLTPVIRNCQGKGLVEIARELRELAAKARDRKLSEEELSGGVQTISNLGMYSVSQFDAIINPPESSILAVSSVEEKPVVRGGELVIGKVFQITLTSDHRVVDGATAASYLNDLKAALEDPLLIMA